jgi:pyruvate/2-oxoglutarate dehydrogenase complex dihydrolipoamide dehydrogenase (E3) component
VARRLQEDGVAIRTSASIDSMSGQLDVDAVLVAAGRTPNIEGLNLDAVSVGFDENGIHVDDRLRTSNSRIYAAGDICSPFKFTHAADAMSRIVIQNALFFGRRRTSRLVIPWCTYTFPDVAHVGLTPDALAERETGRITVALGEVDRSVIDDETEGFLRIHHERGRIVAATIVAPHAGELIAYVADIMRRGGSVGDFSSAIFPYPTVADALRKAGDAYRRQALTPGVRKALRLFFRITRR